MATSLLVLLKASCGQACGQLQLGRALRMTDMGKGSWAGKHLAQSPSQVEAKLGLRTQVPEDQLRGPGSLEGAEHLGDQETHSKRTSQG